MPIQIQQQTVSFSNSTSSCTFSFESDTVYSYAVGIAYFRLSYGQDTDHYVETLSVQVTPSQPNPNEVYCDVQIDLHDASDNYADYSDCSVVVGIVALTGNADTQIGLYSESSPVDNGSTETLGFGGSGSSGVATISGFDLSYGTTDHWVQTIQMSAVATMTSDGSSLAVEAAISDASNNNASTATVTPGLVGYKDDADVLAVAIHRVESGIQEFTASPIPVPDGYQVDQAVALIQSMNITYGDTDHELSYFEAGANVTPSIGGNSVTVSTQSGMGDASGNHENQQSSSVEIAVIASLAQTASQ